MNNSIGQLASKQEQNKFNIPKFYNTRQNKFSRSPKKIISKLNNSFFCFSQKNSAISCNSKGTEQTHYTLMTQQNLKSINQSQQLGIESLIQNDNSSEEKQKNQDAGHFVHQKNQLINKKYEIVKILGEGTFGRVFEVKQIFTKKHYALKMIRAVERFIENAQIEASIIQRISSYPSSLQLYEHFLFQNNYCLVFEKLGCSLYDFLKQNKFRGFPIKYIQSFFSQILQQMSFFHSIKLTHTDIKPENILLKSVGKILCKKQKGSKFYIPKSCEIKLVDFGGATFGDQHHSSIINTKQYRAPEVILGCCQWDMKSDNWGIACVIIELYSGRLLFDTHQTYEHLAIIEKISGPIPKFMTDNCRDELTQYFTKKKLNWPIGAQESSIQKVQQTKSLDQIIHPDHYELKNLLQLLLIIDPKKRISCEQALEHPFFSFKYQEI